jgi:peptide/nickel transport system substrate-binding protein
MRTRRPSTLIALMALVIGPLILAATAQGTPEGEMALAWHVTIAPAWFDPIDTPAQITPYGALHALHDALVRPLPGEKMGNSLAESWTESPEQVPGFGAFKRCKGGACKSPLSVL